MTQRMIRMCRFFIVLFFFSFQNNIDAQTAPLRYWVKFNTKQGTPYSIDHPEAFLSPESIQRRIKESIPVDELDLPLNPSFVAQVAEINGLTVVQRSKWFNAVSVQIVDSLFLDDALASIQALPFVSEVRSVQMVPNDHSTGDKLDVRSSELNADRNIETDSAMVKMYGESWHQLSMMNGHRLHELGYTGQGMVIAQLDAGWTMTDLLPAFDRAYDEGRILGTRDFVFPQTNNVYSDNAHGTFVLSIMTGYMPDSLVGSAPDASYYLFRTENPQSEFLAEEDNWVAAAEVCDSLGVDLINSSLGYSEFDNASQNHTYSDMDGNTTRCTIAADIASSKGILVVNSAGNSGDNPWHYLTAPSDGDLVLCVGAVKADSSHAAFSSFGPSSDGDVKPNVVTMGQWTTFAALDSTARQGNGTSFSSPVMCGMAACLMQAFPEKKASEIKSAIERSAHLYNAPNDSMGYGIPDMWKAFLILEAERAEPQGDYGIRLFPNPTYGALQLTLNAVPDNNLQLEIFDASGRIVQSGAIFTGVKELSHFRTSIDVSTLSEGSYTLRLMGEKGSSAARFIKITY